MPRREGGGGRGQQRPRRGDRPAPARAARPADDLGAAREPSGPSERPPVQVAPGLPLETPSPDVDTPTPIQSQRAEPEPEEEFPPAQTEDYTSAAYARLGAEGLARLRARYAEVMARITEKPLDETAKDELKTQAERLNPDAWVTADEVTAGLEQYETVFESLRAVVGHRRRRRR